MIINVQNKARSAPKRINVLMYNTCFICSKKREKLFINYFINWLLYLDN